MTIPSISPYIFYMCCKPVNPEKDTLSIILLRVDCLRCARGEGEELLLLLIGAIVANFRHPVLGT